VAWKEIEEDFDNSELHIRGEIDGETVDAYIEFLALDAAYETGTEGSYWDVFRRHRGGIIKVVREKWADGDTNDDGSVTICQGDL
jgi:hypothetical protein